MISLFNEEQHDTNPALIQLTPNHAIAFRPKPRTTRNYGVSIKYYGEHKDEPVKRVDYQIQLHVNQYKNLENTWQLSFNKHELFMNRHEPDLISEQLAAIAMKALYPINVDVNSQNEVFRGIANHPEILQRWKKTAEKIQEKYLGDITKLFIEKMSFKMENQSRIIQALEYDMFWKAFFHTQYLPYRANRTLETVFVFPVLPYQYCKFEGKQELEESYTDYATYKVNFRSEMELPASMEGEPDGKMKLTANFDLDKEGGLLKHAVINWHTPGRSIKFTAYEIENKTDTKSAEEQNLTIEQQPTQVKKGFWDRILG